MGLRESDKEYKKMLDEGTIEDRIEYCENLIRKMRDRLNEENSSTEHIRTLMQEMIESAERELATLRSPR